MGRLIRADSRLVVGLAGVGCFSLLAVAVLGRADPGGADDCAGQSATIGYEAGPAPYVPDEAASWRHDHTTPSAGETSRSLKCGILVR